ncbi:MAG TPA: beta-lactamase family protein [Candidatus Stackebrandtia excrementipullorum]|nr:beta-lactamase family protein [Candidatus Stackebrandtia excrementipullorum]
MTNWEGDADLAGLAMRILGRPHKIAAVAAVTPTGTSIAMRGAKPDADFEIGSIAKGITGLLYTEALADGLVDENTVLGDLLPFDENVPAASISLRAIAVHRSGLPGLPSAMKPWRRTAKWLFSGANPYGHTLDEMLEHTRSVQLLSDRPRYSNLGFQLLGHAVAAARGCDYRRLLEERFTKPLGLATFFVPFTDEELLPTSLLGHSLRGRTQRPWVGEAFAPCGGIRATIGSMRDVTAALVDGSVPGVEALDPVERFTGGMRIGAGWITSRHNGRQITWHNGATGGFCSWLGLDREAGTGLVVLTAKFRPVNQPALRLLAEISLCAPRCKRQRRSRDQRRRDHAHDPVHPRGHTIHIDQ